MQLTIDSNEPLEKVTEVVGALYGVRLVVSDETGGPAGPTDVATSGDVAGDDADSDASTGDGSSSDRRREAAIAASKAARRSAGRARRGGKRVDAAVVRQWALEQGMTVSNRGQLPKAVLVAYTEQNG